MIKNSKQIIPPVSNILPVGSIIPYCSTDNPTIPSGILTFGVLAGGGSGYAVGDIVELNSGSRMIVTSVNTGAITGLALIDNSIIKHAGTNPMTLTTITGGGSSAGITLNISGTSGYAVGDIFTLDSVAAPTVRNGCFCKVSSVNSGQITGFTILYNGMYNVGDSCTIKHITGSGNDAGTIPVMYTGSVWGTSYLTNYGLSSFNNYPDGYLLCDGSAIKRGDYPELFKLIGCAYGSGNGSTTYNLPDYRGRFLRGNDLGASKDPASSSSTDFRSNQGSSNTVTVNLHANKNYITLPASPTSLGIRLGMSIHSSTYFTYGIITGIDDSNNLIYYTGSRSASDVTGTAITVFTSDRLPTEAVGYPGSQYCGTIQDDAFQEHKIQPSISGATFIYKVASGGGYAMPGAGTTILADTATGTPVADTGGTPRMAIESRPVNISVNFLIKVK